MACYLQSNANVSALGSGVLNARGDEMVVTICTLYDDSMSEHYVAVVEGLVCDADRRNMAEGFKARLPTDLDEEGSDYEDERVLYFVEVNLSKSPKEIHDLVNIDGRKAS